MAEFGSHCFNGRVGQLFVDNEVRIVTPNVELMGGASAPPISNAELED